MPLLSHLLGSRFAAYHSFFLLLLIISESLLTPNRAPSCYLGIKDKSKKLTDLQSGGDEQRRFSLRLFILSTKIHVRDPTGCRQ